MSQKVAYVTGGMGGIGTAICQRLHKDGFKVIAGCGPSRDHAKWIDEQKALGYTFYASVGNVSDWDSTVEAFKKTKAEHGPVDVLVNNAGITKDGMFRKMSKSDWDSVIDTNLNSLFNVTKQVIDDMVDRGWGRIVNIASVAGMRAVGSGRTAYGTSKGAVIALTRQMAVELAEHGITANAVAPGPVDTPMTQVLHTEAFRQEYSKAIPMNRYGTTAEIAAAVMYLVSEDAAYTSGIAMPVDGGFLASGARGL